MLTTPSHLRALLLAPMVLIGLGRPGWAAEELPPDRSPAHTAVYNSMTRSKEDPTDEAWDFTKEDTVTIAVSGDNARWEQKSDGGVSIHDYKTKRVVEFGGKHVPEGTANRIQFRRSPIRWELGYWVVAAATEEKPKVLGQDTIAGTSCTRLTFDSVQYGKPEYCVAKDGIVLRFTNSSENAETRYEAVSVTRGEPDPKSFAVPTGLQIKERRQ